MKRIATLLLLSILSLSMLTCGNIVTKKMKPEGPTPDLPITLDSSITPDLPIEILYEIAQQKILLDMAQAQNPQELKKIYETSLEDLAKASKQCKALVEEVKESDLVVAIYNAIKAELKTSKTDAEVKKILARIKENSNYSLFNPLNWPRFLRDIMAFLYSPTDEC